MRKGITAAVAACLIAAAGPVLAKPLTYIRDAQRLLAVLGYHVGELDGEFDAEFESALNHFKRDENLPADGRFDGATRAALNKAFADRASRKPPSPRVVAVAPAPLPAYEPPAAPADPVAPLPPDPVPSPVSAPVPASAPVASAPVAPVQRDELFVGFVTEVALEFGGDTIATVGFDDQSTQDIKAGQGFTFSLGGLVRSGRTHGPSLRGTIGYKYVGTKDDDSSIDLTRIAGELVGGWLFPSGLWLGAGPVYHTAIEFDQGRFGPPVEFDDAIGGTVELGWRWVALTYTAIDYSVEDADDIEFDAGNVGLMFSYAFGR